MTFRAPLYLAIALLIPAALLAHPGGLDSRGGHLNVETGQYHFHPKFTGNVATNGKAATRKRKRESDAEQRKTFAEKRLRLATAQLASGIENLQLIAENYPEEEAGQNAAKLCAHLEKEFAAINAVLDGNTKPEVDPQPEEDPDAPFTKP